MQKILREQLLLSTGLHSQFQPTLLGTPRSLAFFFSQAALLFLTHMEEQMNDVSHQETLWLLNERDTQPTPSSQGQRYLLPSKHSHFPYALGLLFLPSPLQLLYVTQCLHLFILLLSLKPFPYTPLVCPIQMSSSLRTVWGRQAGRFSLYRALQIPLDQLGRPRAYQRERHSRPTFLLVA